MHASCTRPRHCAGTVPLRILAVRPVVAGSGLSAMRQAEPGRCATSVKTRSRLAGDAPALAAPENTCPVRRAGQQAVVTPPGRMCISSTGQITTQIVSRVLRTSGMRPAGRHLPVQERCRRPSSRSGACPSARWGRDRHHWPAAASPCRAGKPCDPGDRASGRLPSRHRPRRAREPLASRWGRPSAADGRSLGEVESGHGR